MSNDNKSVSNIDELTEAWENLIEHFNSIRDDLKKLKDIRKGELNEIDHQLTINQVIKKIYEVM
jgi:hypothetical protein